MRREDKQTERYAEALRNLYTTDKKELQLLGVRDLYNVYLEEDKPEFKQSLKKKILDNIFEYPREVGVNIKEVSDKNHAVKSVRTVNKIFNLFMKEGIKLLGDQINLKEANLYRATLTDVELERANLQGVTLRLANLKGSDLLLRGRICGGIREEGGA